MNYITGLINHYGYIMIFIALMLELIAFPLPGEAIMTYCGFLTYESKMNELLAIIIAASGVITGITIAYFAGLKLGKGFFNTYGSYIHLTPEKIEKTSIWFNAYGKRLLILAFFIPGVRHITGYFSGITKISKKKFMLNAYLGAFIWATTFISLGRALGPNWHRVDSFLKKYIVLICLILSLILITFYAYKNHRAQITEFILEKLTKGMTIFHSMGNMKAAMAVIGVAFLGFFVLVIGAVQDYLGNETQQLNAILSDLVRDVFSKKWTVFFRLLDTATSPLVLAALAFILILWILYIHSNPFLEIRFVFITIGGGEVLQYALSHLLGSLSAFSKQGLIPSSHSFPSSHSLMSIVAFGFFAYMVLRHVQRPMLGTSLIIATIFICLFSGLSPLYFQSELGSDVYAGFIFGGAWLTVNIILMEIYRILPRIKFE